MRSGLALTLAFAVLGVAGCGDGSDDGYPQESIDAFVKECAAQPNTAERQCRCVIVRLQKTLPYEQFAQLDKALKENGRPDEASIGKLRAAVTACSTS